MTFFYNPYVCLIGTHSSSFYTLILCEQHMHAQRKVFWLKKTTYLEYSFVNILKNRLLEKTLRQLALQSECSLLCVDFRSMGKKSHQI